MMRASILSAALAASLPLLLPSRDLFACAAAPVSTSGEIGAGAQRILITTRGGATEVVVEMTVPQTTADYGVLIPVPARPTLDPVPVDSEDLDQVDQATRPQIFDGSASGGGIGCGSAADRGGLNGLGVEVIEKVNIGPLEVVVLTASAASELTQWLSSNGFRIPTGKEQVLTRYTGIGNYFIAARRDDRAAPGSPSRIGVHFTLPGTQLTIPLPAVQLGGGGEVGVTLFVAVEEGVGSMTPYTSLTLNDLDGALLSSNYRGAVQAAVSARSGMAFVVEGIYQNAAASILPPSLAAFAAPRATLTRMSTVADPAAFTADLTVAIAGAPAEAPSSRTVGEPADGGCSAAGAQASSLVYLLFFASHWRWRRPGSSSRRGADTN